MNSNAVPMLTIFEKKMRLEVPLFQRQYVWHREGQWEPLWEDLERKFFDYLSGRKDSPPHFLGALVLDQKQTPTTFVERRQIIDGQQRLTTLQLFLAALRDLCRVVEGNELADEIDSFVINKGKLPDPEVDKFKVWPTQLDRAQFADVLTAGSRAALESKHPLTYRKYARKPNPRPRMVEAYTFFYEQLAGFMKEYSTPSNPSNTSSLSLLEDCFQALQNTIQVVVIDLERNDDPQVIFETLNARGEPLLPADLLRNYIFLRAARQGEPQEELYERYWRKFDDPFWREEVRQGRLNRPRSDLFMQHFLSSRESADIPIRHLFVEYKYWIEHERPFVTVREELEVLARQGEDFRRIVAPKKDDVTFSLATFLDTFDISTAYPLLLRLMDVQLSDADWRQVSSILESYLLRRAVCGLTTKNYNRVFLGLTRAMQEVKENYPERIRSYLRGLSGETVEWPLDEAFHASWQTRHAYQTLQNSRIVHIFKRLNDTYLSELHEPILFGGQLTVEHIMPQDWVANWPLPDGSKGLTWLELLSAGPDDQKAQESRQRNAILQTVGNLTILTQPLNSSLSNAPWNVKKPALLQASLLPINQQLREFDTWDETTIQIRSEGLFERALKVWPRS